MGRAFWGLALFASALLAAPASGQNVACRTVADSTERLACWDKVFPPTEASNTPIVSQDVMPPLWSVRTSTSQMDDSTSVYVTVRSRDTVRSRFSFRDDEHAELTLRCLENRTAVILQMGNNYMSDIQGYGVVTYRIDDGPAKKLDFRESTDHSVLGLWSGGASIPFIKQLFGAERIVMRATPFSESAVEAVFDIYGTEQAIEPLRKACNW